VPRERIVIALGGNAILQPGQKGTSEEQAANVDVACKGIARLIAEGAEVVLTHGNGPQVGNALIRSEESAQIIPPSPLHVCGAQTQGELGFYIQKSLGNNLTLNKHPRPVVTVVTQTLVDADDPAFQNPTKPVGPFYTPAKAAKIMETRGWVMVEDSGRGWRRVVASPKPLELIEAPAIRRLVDSGAVVVASGGGGIPVRRCEDGTLTGVEAVIDKDLAGAVLARDVEATKFIVLTDVDGAYINFKRPDKKLLRRLDTVEAARLMQEGQFGTGSMGPKIQAAMSFAESTGKPALITSLGALEQALSGKTGTVVVAAEAKSVCSRSADGM